VWIRVRAVKRLFASTASSVAGTYGVTQVANCRRFRQLMPTKSDASHTARELVKRLGLEPHPEGGWYREIHRSSMMLATPRGPRAALTSIYFLLEQRQYSRWHVVTSDEVWHYGDGAPLELLVYRPETRELTHRVLGPVRDAQEPIGIARAGEWQAARSLGGWSLVGCDVAPGFDFEDFQFVAGIPGHESHFTGRLQAFADFL
jgi:predicted cupin superfamily sugar epimerase